jgi:hypothetical protein
MARYGEETSCVSAQVSVVSYALFLADVVKCVDNIFDSPSDFWERTRNVANLKKVEEKNEHNVPI